MIKAFLLACLWLLLVLPPLLLGANRPIFWALNGLITAFALIAFGLREYRAPLVWRDPIFWAVAAVLGLGAVWMSLQCVSFTPQSWHHPVWQLIPDAPGAISLAPAAGWATLGWWLTLAIFFPAMRAGAENPAFTRTALLTIAVTGAIIATFGMLVEQLQLPTLGLLPKQAYIGWVTGTFVSRNSAAAYFAVGLIICTSILTTPGEKANRARVIAAICAMLLLPALLLTGSRAGIVSALVGLSWLAFLRIRHSRAGAWGGVMIAAFAAPAITLAASALMMRADDSIASNASRFSLYQETIAAIADRPWLGHGAGAFQSVQPLYHQPQTSSEYVWQNAHSLYLEAAATLGLPMAAGLTIACVGIWIALLRRRQAGNGLVAEAALASSLTLALHASVDFALQTQAVALTITILCGLAVGASADKTQNASAR
jgi:O-antigen ligase